MHTRAHADTNVHTNVHMHTHRHKDLLVAGLEDTRNWWVMKLSLNENSIIFVLIILP